MKIHLSAVLVVFWLINTGFAEDLSVTISPAATQHMKVDENVDFSCTPSGGCPPYTYAWTFTNGSPGSSQTQNPGAVTFGNAAFGKESEVKVIVTDALSASVEATVKIILPKVTVTGPGSTIEGTDSAEFEATIEPTGLTISAYSWSATWPNGVGNAPVANFEKPNEKKSKIEKARWFADPDSRWMFEVSDLATYQIKCVVTISGKGFESEDKPWEVQVNDSGTVTPWPIYSGENSIAITENSSDNKWYVTGKGMFTRHGLAVVNNCPADSQFHAQVQEHEEHHVAQFASIAPWKDMWDVDSFYTSDLATLPGMATKALQEAAVTAKLNAWLLQNNQDYQNKQCDMEWDAFQIEYTVAPAYREWRKTDVSAQYGCTF